jgi:hypothetical protein
MATSLVLISASMGSAKERSITDVAREVLVAVGWL